jgi:hypothetical protein
MTVPKMRQGEVIELGVVMAAVKISDLPKTETEEVVALGRMVSFVCQRAKQLNLDMSTYFLEMALTSLVQDIGEREGQASMGGELPRLSSVTDLH